jgi:hypothetical protein
VVSSLAFHYVADLPGLLGRIGQWLRPGGLLLFSLEHPVVTAAPQRGRPSLLLITAARPGGCRRYR